MRRPAALTTRHDAATQQRIGRLQSAHVGPFLAEPLGTVLALAHPHPVAGADHGIQCRFHGGALGETARREQRHRSGIAPHLGIDHHGLPERRHRLWQQLPHQCVDDRFIAQFSDRRGVVEVAGHHRTLRCSVTPEHLFVALLQLIQHEEGGAGAAQCR